MYQPVSWTLIPSAGDYAFDQLRSIDSLIIRHGFSVKQTLPGVPVQAKYGIFTNQEEQLFSAYEESDLFQRICCTNEREFTMHVLDNNGQEIIRVHRDLQSCSGCCWCSTCDDCMHQVTVEAPRGQRIGSVQQVGSGCGIKYVIKDVNNTPMLTVMGPCCICNGAYSCGCQNRYILLGTDQLTEIGSIDKKYPESIRFATANPVAFTIRFPLNLETRMKALLLGALFLIDIANYQMVRLR